MARPERLVIVGGVAAGAHKRIDVLATGIMGRMTIEDLEELDGDDPPLVLDVRSEAEWNAGHLDGAMHIPVDELRRRLAEVPADRRMAVHCARGYRSYVAQRIMMNRGRRDVSNVLGGYELIRQTQAAANPPDKDS